MNDDRNQPYLMGNLFAQPVQQEQPVDAAIPVQPIETVQQSANELYGMGQQDAASANQDFPDYQLWPYRQQESQPQVQSQQSYQQQPQPSWQTPAGQSVVQQGYPQQQPISQQQAAVFQQSATQQSSQQPVQAQSQQPVWHVANQQQSQQQPQSASLFSHQQFQQPQQTLQQQSQQQQQLQQQYLQQSQSQQVFPQQQQPQQQEQQQPQQALPQFRQQQQLQPQFQPQPEYRSQDLPRYQTALQQGDPQSIDFQLPPEPNEDDFLPQSVPPSGNSLYDQPILDSELQQSANRQAYQPPYKDLPLSSQQSTGEPSALFGPFESGQQENKIVMPEQKKGTSALAVVGLIAGIGALVCAFIPQNIVNFVGIGIAAVALVLSIVAIARCVKGITRGKGLAVFAGIVAVAALAAALVMSFIFPGAGITGLMGQSASTTASSSSASAQSGSSSVASTSPSSSASQGSTGSAQSSSSSQSGSSQSSSASSSASGTTAMNLAVGESVSLQNGLSVRVDSVDTSLTTFSGDPITCVSVTYTNIGSTAQNYNLFDWKAVNTNGVQRSATFYIDSVNELDSGTVATNSSVSGNIYFEGTSTKIQYYFSSFENNPTATWTV